MKSDLQKIKEWCSTTIGKECKKCIGDRNCCPLGYPYMWNTRSVKKILRAYDREHKVGYSKMEYTTRK